MAKCVKCGAETQLFDAGVPVCIRCCELAAKSKEAEKKLPGQKTEPPGAFQRSG
jgi:hypothetical protein